MNNRDMYYGYAGFNPMGMPMNPDNGNIPNNYFDGMFNDMNNRVERLERQIKRLDQRLTRLEVPYANNNEPDNDMYIM